MFAKTFRNSLLASSLLIGASLLVGPAAMADDPEVSSEATDVGGSINLINSIDFDTTSHGFERVITANTFELGVLKIQNNNPTGWSLAVTSENGALVNVDNNSETIAYTKLALAAPTGVTLTTYETGALTAEQSQVLAAAGFNSIVAGAVSDFTLTAHTPADLSSVASGEYRDTLSFTLTSNE